MDRVLPFQRTALLISEIDEFIDMVSEAVMLLERTVVHYLDEGADDYLDEKIERIRGIEGRGDELRRNIANVIYAEMLMPDTRGDVLGLLDEVDTILDDCVHIVIKLGIERPDFPAGVNQSLKAILSEAIKAAQAVLLGARAYFKEPYAVRNYVHKINFHNREATAIGLRSGRELFDSELPLERKQQLIGWIAVTRGLASHADDIGDKLAIFAVRRSF